MLFVAEYEFDWQSMDAVMAKRLDWESVQPETFHFIGEYIWHDGTAPFRGVAILEADNHEDLNAFILHYGPSLKMHIHPATDVMSALASVQSQSRAKPKKPRKKKQ